jgi:uncharacterized protein YggE
VRAPTVVGLASVLFAGCASAQTQTPARDITAVIIAGGEGRREIAPDKATIILGVETRSRQPAAAASANADRMTAIRTALTRMGIPERDISTARYSLHFEHGRTPADTQYVANNMITVVTRQLDQVGRIIDTGLGAGANNINSLQYDLNDRTAAQTSALTDAVTDARRQAEAMAAAAGGRLGDLVELSTQPLQYRPYAMDGAQFRMAEMSAAAPTPVSPGSVTIHASVTGRWRFVPGR